MGESVLRSTINVKRDQYTSKKMLKRDLKENCKKDKNGCERMRSTTYVKGDLYTSKETYKRDLKETYKRDSYDGARVWSATYVKGDLYTSKETYKRDLCTSKEQCVKRDLERRPINRRTRRLKDIIDGNGEETHEKGK